MHTVQTSVMSLHSPLTITRWYLRFYYVHPFPNLVWFSIICMLTGHLSVPTRPTDHYYSSHQRSHWLGAHNPRLLCSVSSCIYSHSPAHRPVPSPYFPPLVWSTSWNSKIITDSTIKVSVSSPSPTSLLCSHFPIDSTKKFYSKWASFLGILHPQAKPFWKIARYFTTPTWSVPPLFDHIVQVFNSVHKSELLPQHFEWIRHLKLKFATAKHACMVFCTSTNIFVIPLTCHWDSAHKPIWTPKSNSNSQNQICTGNRQYLRYYLLKAKFSSTPFKSWILFWGSDISPTPGNPPTISPL
jgi:hypothetical protein